MSARPLLLAALVLVGCGESFDSEVWRFGAPQHNTVGGQRAAMVGDLLRRHDLVGMTRADVLELLGAADETAYFADDDLVYWLGPERGLASLDSEWLTLKLDADDIVTEVSVSTD